MGKATILSGGADGNYSIKIDYGVAIRDAKVAKLDARIAELSPQIVEKQVEYDTQQGVVAAAVNLLNEAINAYVDATKADPDPETHKPALMAFQEAAKRVRAEQGNAFAIQIKLDELTTEKNQAIRDKSYWAGLELEVTQDAWCADLTEDAEGEVATIEVPGESALTLIAPGGAAHTAIDGQAVAREVQDPGQLFYNAAILPGWQKFLPTFRIGVIDAIDVTENTADVTLEDATSSAQSLDINRYTDFPGIPVEYLSCNAAAFTVGDRVLVRFEGGAWSSATVIGFVNNPKPCFNLQVYTAASQAVQGFRKAPVSLLSEAAFYAAAVAGDLEVRVRQLCGEWETLTFNPQVDFEEIARWVRPSQANVGIVSVDIADWKPERARIIVHNPTPGTNSGEIRTLEGQILAKWSFYYIGGASFAMTPLLLVPLGEIPFEPSQDVILWDKVLYPDCED